MFDAESGQLILVARDSNVEDDQPKPNHGMDLPDLGRGSVGSLDPFIGLATLPEADNKRYLLAIMSDNMLPTALQGHLLPVNGDANRTYRLVRLEPLEADRHAFELHQAFQGHDALWDYMPYGPFAWVSMAGVGTAMSAA